MREVIEKGYLYIAQPPLYKVRKGQKDKYLKNEPELAEHLLSSGLEGAQIKTSTGVLASSQVVASLKAAARFTKAIDRVAKKLHPEILRGLVNKGVTISTLEKEGELDAVLKQLESELTSKDVRFSWKIERDQEHNCWVAVVDNWIHGTRRTAPINSAILNSTEYEELCKLNQAILTMGEGPYQILTEGRADHSVQTGEELAEVIVEKTKSGLTIQRYKGLGEMNPEQLWETTMDPSRRTLLKVSVDDAVEADAIFSVLMGDQVEPRRQFIEENALRVRNLDI
jgi:DNA gyrase subunit B